MSDHYTQVNVPLVLNVANGGGSIALVVVDEHGNRHVVEALLTKEDIARYRTPPQKDAILGAEYHSDEVLAQLIRIQHRGNVYDRLFSFQVRPMVDAMIDRVFGVR
jgi:hypothetical protein